MSPIRLVVALLVVMTLTLAATVDRGEEAWAGADRVGDANCDGVVNPVDSTLILQLGAGLIVTVPCPENGDTNGDGLINPLDSALILQFAAGLIDELTLQEPTMSPTPVHLTNTPTNTVPSAPTSTPQPTVTPEPSVTLAPTEMPPPTTDACAFSFATQPSDPAKFCGEADEAVTTAIIPGADIWPPLPASSGTQFVLILLNVENFGAEKADVTTSSFRLRDDLSRSFTLGGWAEWATATLTAKAFYELNGVFDPLQPGTSELMVFVFWTPIDAAGLYLEPCPPGGCGENAISATPTPTVPNPTATATSEAPPTIDLTRCAEELFAWAQSFYTSPTAKLNVEIYCGAHPDVFTGGSSVPISADHCADALYEWALSGFTSVSAELDVNLWC